MSEEEFNECPYCGMEFDAGDYSGDQLSDGETAEEECRKCGKAFMIRASYSVDFNTWKAPCLNDGDHDWQPIIGQPAEFFVNKERCSYCQEKRTKPNLQEEKTK